MLMMMQQIFIIQFILLCIFDCNLSCLFCSIFCYKKYLIDLFSVAKLSISLITSTFFWVVCKKYHISSFSWYLFLHFQQLNIFESEIETFLTRKISQYCNSISIRFLEIFKPIKIIKSLDQIGLVKLLTKTEVYISQYC